MPKPPRSFFSFVSFAVVMSSVLLPVAAQDEETKEAVREETSEPAEEKLFVVPDGTTGELFAFINKVKRTRSEVRTREASIAHLKEQVEAVLEACDRIMADEPDVATELKVVNERLGAYRAARSTDLNVAEKEKELLAALESDTRPEIVKFWSTRRLTEKASTVRSMSDKERAEFVDELFTLITDNGIDRSSYGTATTVARYLGVKNPEEGAQIYERLAAAMEKSEDEDWIARMPKALGAARRMRLPGNFMEVMGQTADGEEFDWAAYRGKVVLVDFWASWCGPCRAEIPNMKDQLKNYADKGFAIVGVNLDTSKERYQQYVDAQELTWTNLMSDNPEEMGWDNPLATYYGVNGIPTAILVDKEGKVVSLSARGNALNAKLLELLGPVDPPASEAAEEESGESDESSPSTEK